MRDFISSERNSWLEAPRREADSQEANQHILILSIFPYFTMISDTLHKKRACFANREAGSNGLDIKISVTDYLVYGFDKSIPSNERPIAFATPSP